jgi:Arc/MetJ-type ribon-helix-helix transcriptional regulator
MVVMKRRAKMVSIRLSDDEYQRLKEMTQAQGARSVSDVARSAMQLMLSAHDAGSDGSIESRVRELDGRVTVLKREVQRLSEMMSESSGKGVA